jgi:hypothetical protein
MGSQASHVPDVLRYKDERKHKHEHEHEKYSTARTTSVDHEGRGVDESDGSDEGADLHSSMQAGSGESPSRQKRSHRASPGTPSLQVLIAQRNAEIVQRISKATEDSLLALQDLPVSKYTQVMAVVEAHLNAGHHGKALEFINSTLDSIDRQASKAVANGQAEEARWLYRLMDSRPILQRFCILIVIAIGMMACISMALYPGMAKFFNQTLVGVILEALTVFVFDAAKMPRFTKSLCLSLARNVGVMYATDLLAKGPVFHTYVTQAGNLLVDVLGGATSTPGGRDRHHHYRDRRHRDRDRRHRDRDRDRDRRHHDRDRRHHDRDHRHREDGNKWGESLQKFVWGT